MKEVYIFKNKIVMRVEDQQELLYSIKKGIENGVVVLPAYIDFIAHISHDQGGEVAVMIKE